MTKLLTNRKVNFRVMSKIINISKVELELNRLLNRISKKKKILAWIKEG